LLFVVFPRWVAIGASALKRASSSCAWPRAAIVPIVSMITKELISHDLAVNLSDKGKMRQARLNEMFSTPKRSSLV
ncbi:hypothetical protein T492DRAFT_1022333, partial [Pavlovales sp. CCMP2436]